MNYKTITFTAALLFITAPMKESAAVEWRNDAYYNYMSKRVVPMTETRSTYNVANIQQLLIESGYDVGPYGATGYINTATVNAVMDFQSRHGLRVDGVVGPSTARALNGTKVYAYAPVYMDKNAQNIAAIQTALIELGYYVGTQGANGIYNASTAEAVKHFQHLNSLPQSGMADAGTVNLLSTQIDRKRMGYKPNVRIMVSSIPQPVSTN